MVFSESVNISTQNHCRSVLFLASYRRPYRHAMEEDRNATRDVGRQCLYPSAGRRWLLLINRVVLRRCRRHGLAPSVVTRLFAAPSNRHNNIHGNAFDPICARQIAAASRRAVAGARTRALWRRILAERARLHLDARIE